MAEFRHFSIGLYLRMAASKSRMSHVCCAERETLLRATFRQHRSVQRGFTLQQITVMGCRARAGDLYQRASTLGTQHRFRSGLNGRFVRRSHNCSKCETNQAAHSQFMRSSTFKF